MECMGRLPCLPVSHSNTYSSIHGMHLPLHIEGGKHLEAGKRVHTHTHTHTHKYTHMRACCLMCGSSFVVVESGWKPSEEDKRFVVDLTVLLGALKEISQFFS